MDKLFVKNYHYFVAYDQDYDDDVQAFEFPFPFDALWYIVDVEVSFAAEVPHDAQSYSDVATCVIHL